MAKSKKRNKPYVGRNIWERKPMTQVVPNKKAYNRKKNRGERYEEDSHGLKEAI